MLPSLQLNGFPVKVKTNKSRLLIALIVIRNSAFYCDRNFWNLKTWRHKKYGVKTFSCSHCDKKFGLFWQEFLKLEDMKTQTVLCQNAVSLYHLGKEIQGPIAVNLFMFLQNRFFFSIDLSFQDLFNFNFSVSNNKSPLLIPISYPCEELKCMHKQKVWTFLHSGNTNAVYYTQLGCNQVAFLIKWCFMI